MKNPENSENLFKAFQIFLKYGNPRYPTSSENYGGVIWGINPAEVSAEGLLELENLNFSVNCDKNFYYSLKFAVC